MRGTALGWALDVGRLRAVAAPQVGGLLLVMGMSTNSNFVVFAVGPILAAALLLGIAIQGARVRKNMVANPTGGAHLSAGRPARLKNGRTDGVS